MSNNHQIPSEMENSEMLSVKELAMAMDVSTRFVYQMRFCGFFMHGDIHQRQRATVEEARAWIKENHFRLVKSIGVIGNRPCPPEKDSNGGKQ